MPGYFLAFAHYKKLSIGDTYSDNFNLILILNRIQNRL